MKTMQPNPQNATVETVRPADLVTQPPEPASHVVDAMRTARTEDPKPPEEPGSDREPGDDDEPQKAAEVDSAGVRFDPEKHSHGRHGKTGRWMPRRPKRKGNLRSEFTAPDPSRPFVPESELKTEPGAGDGPPEVDPYAMAAHSTCAILYAVGMTIGGDEWKPSKDEHANLSAAWENYYRAKGFKDIPPGWAVAIATVSYIGPRVRQPKTLSTMERIGAGVRGAVGTVVRWFHRRRTIASMPKPPAPGNGVQS